MGGYLHSFGPFRPIPNHFTLFAFVINIRYFALAISTFFRVFIGILFLHIVKTDFPHVLFHFYPFQEFNMCTYVSGLQIVGTFT